jgi:hypothetical protein
MFEPKLRRKSSGFHTGALIISLVAMMVTGWLVLNRQLVVDQLSVWQYQPTSSVASLATRADMSDKGRFIFYASQPAVEDSEQFNQNCGRKEQSTAILGCYDGRRIYVYNIVNAQLDGIKEVTAAHEMLHAAYQRMDAAEKTRVDALIEAEYAKLKDNKELADRLAFYARTEPGERDNELHSVIGTEVATISPELEAHYKNYFSDRQATVALHAKYDSVFAGLQAQSAALSAQLTVLGDAIEKGSASYNTAVAQLNQDVANFNSRAASGGFSSRSEFESARSALVARANALNAQRDQINGDVVRYNALRAELSQLAVQTDALNRSIDSSLSPAPSV